MLPRVYHVLTEVEAFSNRDGGAISRVVANLLQGDPQGRVIAPGADGSWQFPEESVSVAEGFGAYGKLTRYRHFRLPMPFRLALLAGFLRGALSELGPGEVVWVHNRAEVAAALSPLVAARGAKLVLHMHNSHLLSEPQARVLRRIELKRMVFVSNFIRDECIEYVPKDIPTSVLYNGADESLFYPRDRASPGEHSDPIVLFASRLVPEKGVHVFIEAMRLLQTRGVAASGIIMGGPAFGTSKPTDYIRGLHEAAPSNVVFKPYCSGPQLAATFRDADIFCLPSIFNDPFPLAPLEAMASRVPVVTTHTGGIPEAFADGGAILVAKNSPSELAAGLERLLIDPVLRTKLSDAGYVSYKKRFTWTRIRHQYQSIVDAVVDRQLETSS